MDKVTLTDAVGSELGTIIVQQAMKIAKLELSLNTEKAKNAELQLQLSALKGSDANGGHDSKHK